MTEWSIAQINWQFLDVIVNGSNGCFIVIRFEFKVFFFFFLVFLLCLIYNWIIVEVS